MQVEKSWAVRLLSMACLSLAAKMEETRVPALSEFSLEDYNFGSSVIQKMELVVLNRLGWRMGSLTPFNFVKFFANSFRCNSPPPNGFSTTVEVILRSMRGTSSYDNCLIPLISLGKFLPWVVQDKPHYLIWVIYLCDTGKLCGLSWTPRSTPFSYELLRV